MVSNAQLPSEALDTKEHIANVATQLFAQQGFDGTSIRDIVERAGVSKPVLYYYFKNKEELYIWLIQEAYEFFLNQLQEIIRGHGDFTQRLRQVIHVYFEGCMQHQDTIRLIYNAAFGTSRNHPKVDIWKFEQDHIQMISKLLQEGMDQGIIRNFPIEQVVMHFSGSITIYISRLLVQGEPLPELDEEQIFDLMMNGLGAQT